MKSFLVLASLIVWLLAPASHAERTLVLSNPFSPPTATDARDGTIDLIYAELGRRIGVKFELQAMSAERGLLNANNGIDDGDVSRIVGLEQQYPNLIRVPEVIQHLQMMAFSRNANFRVTGPESLKSYDVGILIGWKILERMIVESHSLIKLATDRQLFTMLDKNRIDVAVIERLQGLYLLKEMKIEGVRVLEPPFVEVALYPYLNKKHADLVPKMAEALRKMKQDGTYQRILDTVRSRYAP